MADIISVTITGDRALQVKLDELPSRIHDRLVGPITRLTERLEAAVREDAPDRTGKLRSEITSRVYDDPDRITGRVFIAAGDDKEAYGKAAALEYGAHGTAQVSAHEARLDHVFSRLVAPMEVMVRRHSRRLDIAARLFFRGPERALAPEAEAEIRAAIDAAIADL
jgi:hypothetical protein